MLPVHPKLACLYIKGLELSEGFALGCQILDLIPERFGEERQVWADFLRAAVTRREAGVEVSALATTWIRKDPFVNATLTDWYFSLIGQATAPFLDPSRPMPTWLRGLEAAQAAIVVPAPPCPAPTMPGEAVTAQAAVRVPVPLPPAAMMPGGAVFPSPERNGESAQLHTAIGGNNTRASLPPGPAIGGDGEGHLCFTAVNEEWS
jgi:hypothetical protein